MHFGLKLGSMICLILLFPLTLLSVELTPNELTYIRQLGSIKVCIDPDWKPFESLDEQGHYVGIGADLLYLVIRRLGLSVEIIRTKDWDESVDFAKKGQCQILSFLNQTPKRDEWLLFTKSHFEDPNVFITREEHPFISNPANLINETIVFPKGTAMEELIRKDYPNLKVITTESEEEAFSLVSSHKADMAMRSLIVAAYTIKAEGWFNLKIAGQLTTYTNHLRMGVIKSEPMLRDILNKGIDTLSAQDCALIVNRYISIKAETVKDYSLIVKIILVFVAFGVIFLWRYLELKRYNKELLYLSETDLLTKLYNRMKIEKELIAQVSKAQRLSHDFSILLLDIDHFKKINDTFGHPIGDKVLVQMAHIIQENLRQYDIVGRWGGEEFLILCTHSTQDEAYHVAKRIQEAIKQATFFTCKVHTISIGVATLNEHDTPYTLISHADDALYQAKKSGRDTICRANSLS